MNTPTSTGSYGKVPVVFNRTYSTSVDFLRANLKVILSYPCECGCIVTCAICDTDLNTTGGDEKPEAVSLYESAGRYGLVCSLCQTGMFYFDDRPELMRQAADFLSGVRRVSREG